MLPPGALRVLVSTRPVDFRRGMDGLAGYVQQALREDPFSGTVWVFRSRRSDQPLRARFAGSIATEIKLLYWDGTGLCLLSKRLEAGRFRWPRIEDGALRLSPAQLGALLEGLDWARVQALDVRAPQAAQ